MSDTANHPANKPALDPLARLTEITFGLLMALTFTGTMSVDLGLTGGVGAVLKAALGCNLAWGIVDAVIYILSAVMERGRTTATLRRIKAADPAAAALILRENLPANSTTWLPEPEAQVLLQRMSALPSDHGLVRANLGDLRGAGAVFLLVVGSTFPPILPFLFLNNLALAMRLSNLIAVLMLFGIGLALDRLIGGSTVMRVIVPVVGVILVIVTIALGG